MAVPVASRGEPVGGAESATQSRRRRREAATDERLCQILGRLDVLSDKITSIELQMQQTNVVSKLLDILNGAHVTSSTHEPEQELTPAKPIKPHGNGNSGPIHEGELTYSEVASDIEHDSSISKVNDDSRSILSGQSGDNDEEEEGNDHLEVEGSALSDGMLQSEGSEISDEDVAMGVDAARNSAVVDSPELAVEMTYHNHAPWNVSLPMAVIGRYLPQLTSSSLSTVAAACGSVIWQRTRRACQTKWASKGCSSKAAWRYSPLLPAQTGLK